MEFALKKVGILTFSFSCNSGSVLQAYALQKSISSMDQYEVSIINYTKTHYGKPILGQNVFTKPIRNWSLKKILLWSAQIAVYPFRMKKYMKFFREHYVDFSDRPYHRNNLPQLNAKYDKFIVGSDQVWNYGSPQVDDTYFLDFVDDNSKKISYAASFGQKQIPEDKRESAKKYISEFSAISVREPDGVDIVWELTSKEATWVLDPSLLLEKQDYQQLRVVPKKNKYVFLYLRQESERLEEFAKKLAHQKGLEVVKVIYHWRCGKRGRPTATVGPGEWLGYIENADYIVTNSFHGICFSIIFEKEFYIDYLKTSTSSTNSRMEGMLKQFSLSHRHIDDAFDLTSLRIIDYAAVKNHKERRKEESLSYLKSALER